MLILLIPVALVAAALLNHYRPWIRRGFVNQTTSLTDAQIQQCWDEAVVWVGTISNPWHVDPERAATLKPRAVYIKEHTTLTRSGHPVNGYTDGRKWMPYSIHVVTPYAYAVLQYEMQNLALMLAGKSTAGR